MIRERVVVGSVQIDSSQCCVVLSTLEGDSNLMPYQLM